MQTIKSLFLIFLLLCLMCVSIPTFATTYTQIVTAAFGTALTGQATNVRLTVYDSAGNVQIAATNTPSGNAIAESTDAGATANTGVYLARFTCDTTWLPIHYKMTIVGQTGVSASAVIGSERAAAVADGLSASTIANITSGATSAGTAATQSTTAATQATNAATSAATAATQSTNANTQASAANAKLLGNVAAQTGDAYALLGTRVPNVLPTFPTNFSLFAIDGTGKVGANNLPTDYALRATAPTWYLAPTNPTDYARNNVAPSWYATGGDPFAISKTGGTYGAGTWGAYFAAQLVNAVPAASDFVTALFAAPRWQKLEAVETGAYTRSGNVYTFTRQDGSTFTMTLNALSSPTTRVPGS